MDESDIYTPSSKSQGLLSNKEIEEFKAYLIILCIILCLLSQFHIHVSHGKVQIEKHWCLGIICYLFNLFFLSFCHRFNTNAHGLWLGLDEYVQYQNIIHQTLLDC